MGFARVDMSDVKAQLVREHLILLEKYVAYWEEPALRPESMHNDDVAYELLLHAGHHMRFSGDFSILDLLKKRSFQEREQLVGGVFRLLVDARLAEQAEALAQEAMTDDSAGEEFEQYVYERDNVDVVLRVATYVGHEVLNLSREVDSLFFAARSAERALDRVLEEYSTLTALHSETVLFLREHIWRDPNKADRWWSVKLEKMRDELDAPFEFEWKLKKAVEQEVIEKSLGTSSATQYPGLPAAARSSENVTSVRAWVADLLEKWRSIQQPGLTPALGGASSELKEFRLAPRDLAEGHATFTAYAVIDDEAGALIVEFFDEDLGLQKLPWIGFASLVVRSGDRERRYPIDPGDGVVEIGLGDVPGSPGVCMEVQDDQGNRICRLEFDGP